MFGAAGKTGKVRFAGGRLFVRLVALAEPDDALVVAVAVGDGVAVGADVAVADARFVGDVPPGTVLSASPCAFVRNPHVRVKACPFAVPVTVTVYDVPACIGAFVAIMYVLR